MNANFAFPRPQPAVPRPAPAAKPSSQSPDLAGSRESNALRASILDTALELGIGSNSLVADWMFNNPLVEETEEEQETVPSPSLTYGSPTSEESALSPSSSLLHSQYRRDPVINVNGNGGNFNINQNVKKQPGPLIFQRRDAGAVGYGRISDADSNVRVHFNASEASSNINVSNFQTIGIDDNGVAPFDFPIPPRPTTPSGRKLKKKRAGGDGYESDGGYMSESGKKKDKDKKESSSEGKEAKLKEDRKTKKGFIQVINKMSTSNDVQSLSKGYETDGASVNSSSKSKSKNKKSKQKNSSNEIGYETDGGYQSSSGNKKSKGRFFKLPTKSSKGDLRVDVSESVPALPISAEKKSELVVPLPIAERFATTLSPSSVSSHSMSYPTIMEDEGSHSGSPLPALSFLPFGATPEPTTSKLPSPVSSTFSRPATAPTSSVPSAFIPNSTLLPQDRDSRSSAISSSSSGSGSNQQPKPQKRIGLFSPPPSSMQGHQQHGLRTAWSMSSLKPPHPVISLPITRSSSPNSAGQLSSSPLLPHSRSVSPLPPYVSPTTSVAPLQIKKSQRPKPPLDDLSLPPHQGSGSAMVRPRNPPTDGFGPRSTPTLNSGLGSTPGPSPIPSPGLAPASPNSSSGKLSPLSYSENLSRRPSQLSIIPSSDYIVPSPPISPSKMHHTQGLPSPLSAYYHHDLIPPPSPAPIGPLPTLPSSKNPSPLGNGGASAGQFPSAAQLGQRMSLMRQPVQQDQGTGLGTGIQRGRDPPFPSRPMLWPSQSTVVNGSISTGGSGQEIFVGIHRYRDLGNNGAEPSAGDNAKYRREEVAEARRPRVPTNRQSWIGIEEDTSLDESEDQQEELYDILDRFESPTNESGDSSPGGRALEISHSPKAGKFEKEEHHHFDSPDARPRQINKPPVDDYAFEEDGKTIGDRTSRWSGSVYSNASILDEDESEETRDRFVRRVEAMLDIEKKMAKNRAHAHGMGGPGPQAYIPPLPKIPDAYANIIRKPNGNINQNAGTLSNITPRRSWNKF